LRPTGAGDRLKTSQTKFAGGDPRTRRPRRLRRCANQDRLRGSNYTSNQGGHATFNGCVRLDTSGTRQLVETVTVRAAYSRCGHAYITVACVLPLAGFPEIATLISGGASTSRKCNPKMPGASSFSKTSRYLVPSTLARLQQFSWLRNQLEPLPKRLRTAFATTNSRPPSSRNVSVGARGGSEDPETTSTEVAAPTTPP
jgi:hypothetical protein